ncbi:MAG: YmaF family, partial [Sporomusa sp.]|nr:YmaF family [Sporomusa sp.]
GKHVHFVSGTTTEVDEHVHTFVFATLIENPIGDRD